MGEPKEALARTRARIEPTSKGLGSLPKSIFALQSDDKLIVYKDLLFGMQIPYDKYALFPSNITATMINNYLYKLKLARSIVFGPNRSYVMKRTINYNLFELINLNLNL